MKINDNCIGCCTCIPYCPMEAIKKVDNKCLIDKDECVECGICLRNANCPVDAIYEEKLDKRRNLRKAFSNPLISHTSTNVLGRGTEEIKTNEVTGLIKRGQLALAVELGRPGIGTRFYDVEKITRKLSPLGVNFAPANPVTTLMADKKTGKLPEDILQEKVLSVIVEFIIEESKLIEVLKAIKEVDPELDTVFSLDLAGRLEKDNTFPAAEIVKSLGFNLYINGKTNMGLGRPKVKENE